jgi:hypothetical protein
MRTGSGCAGKIPFFASVVVALGVLLSGCASEVVTHALRTDRFEFNEAIVQSWNEQLLLNLVRLRYRDNPLFLEMGSIIAGYTLKGTAGASGGIVFAPQVTDDLRLSLGGEYSFTPTMSYTPLQGEDFATRLLSPITPLTVLYLSQSGWSLARLFTVCVQEANTVPNAVTASGPTPDIAPEFDSFRELAEALRELQIKGLLLVALDTDGKTVLLHIMKGKGQTEDAAVAVVRRILALDPDTSVYRVKPGLVREGATEIAVMGRSLLAVMFFLSQGIEVPSLHESQGKVTVTRRSNGERFDWSELTGRVFRVRSSEAAPEDAFVRVFYRGHWFFIADTDLNSKTTFNLLTYLFNLKAAGKTSQEPLMTYPVR